MRCVSVRGCVSSRARQAEARLLRQPLPDAQSNQHPTPHRAAFRFTGAFLLKVIVHMDLNVDSQGLRASLTP